MSIEISRSKSKGCTGQDCDKDGQASGKGPVCSVSVDDQTPPVVSDQSRELHASPEGDEGCVGNWEEDHPQNRLGGIGN